MPGLFDQLRYEKLISDFGLDQATSRIGVSRVLPSSCLQHYRSAENVTGNKIYLILEIELNSHATSYKLHRALELPVPIHSTVSFSSNYSGREAPSLKICLVCVCVCVCVCRFFGVATFALWTLICSRPDDTYFVVSRTV